jgi:hypothetical protein
MAIEVDPTASLTLYVDTLAETLEIMFYENDDDTKGKMIAMTGDLSERELVHWLAESAAHRHGIDFHEELVE